MAEFHRLSNQIKHYDWGSTDFIPGLLGLSGDGRPYAELWMGSHAGSPSQVRLPQGPAGLGELIARDTRRYLGEMTAERYGSLPYLFKLLAAEKPLSIQVHPNLDQAREGFDRENVEGLAPDAPNRNYRDSNHKPEIVCALTPFTGMCGFRTPGETERLVAAFLGNSPPAVLRDGFAPLLRALKATATDSALRNFLAALFGVSAEVRKALTDFILLPGGSAAGGPVEWELMRGFARQYPGDPAVIAPLYLNVFRLRAGEAVFLKAGVLHAYIHGFAVELMANSDNVLRGGLTQKHVDVPELMKVLDFTPMEPRIMKPEPGRAGFTYPVPCDEFSLTVMHGTGGQATLVPNGPSICIVTEGEACVEGEILQRGESIFVPPIGKGEKPLSLSGSYTLYIASVGAFAGKPADA
ncbi:MAG: mannose-6-phosphate isomerase, class I [Treponema sp.]|nr:mannose-6-phosphate isomerase, class I [Treponema sp.]